MPPVIRDADPQALGCVSNVTTEEPKAKPNANAVVAAQKGQSTARSPGRAARRVQDLAGPRTARASRDTPDTGTETKGRKADT